MKFFIGTANIEEIRKANDMGVIAGVTTNPSLIAKEGRDYATVLKEIAQIVDGPISGEVKATVPYKVIEQMTKHPLTNQGIIKFQNDYRKVFGDK